MTIRFGVTLPQFTSDPNRFAEGAERARDLGFDSIWVFDHIWPLGGEPDQPILECWSAVAWLAARTDLRIGTLVTRSSLRRPALLGKMAATVGAIAPGRFTVAIGSGDNMNREENISIGAPFFTGTERVHQLVSAVEVVQRFLNLPEVTLIDDFVDVKDLPVSPRPPSAPAVWVGGRSVEILEIAGRIADGWNGWGANLDGFAADAGKVRAVAGDRAFEVSWAGQVVLGHTEAEARRALGERDPVQHLVGTPEHVAEMLATTVAAGATHLIASLPSVRLEDYDALAQVARLVRD